jgi:prepilin-type N-terminal cleavage/methylation domain-containing protein
MRNSRHPRGLLGRTLGDSRGFSLPELMLVATVSVGVALAAAVAYQGTVRSWRGTAALLGLQRDASLAVEMIQNEVRPASNVVVSADGDSIDIYYPDSSGADSLAATFYVDAQGYVRDMNGTALTSPVDSLRFRYISRTLDIDFVLRDDLGTQERTTDDQGVYMSSSAICRNN